MKSGSEIGDDESKIMHFFLIFQISVYNRNLEVLCFKNSIFHSLDCCIQIYIKGNSNFELRTAICYANVENYFLTIIKHIIAVPSSSNDSRE